jgi:hypothetical protein
LSINRCSASVHNPYFFPDLKIQPTGILTIKSQIPFRIDPESGSAVPVSIHKSDLTASKINAELPLESLLPQFPLVIQDLALAFQIPSSCSKDVSCGTIIETLLTTQPLEMTGH